MTREEKYTRDVKGYEGLYRVNALGIEALSKKHQLSEETSTMGVDISTNTPTDLISRADAIEAICNECGGCDDTRADCLEITILKALPSIDRPSGEWRHTITGQPYCSNCEYVFGEDEEFNSFWDYCPMCGAKIKGDDTE